MKIWNDINCFLLFWLNCKSQSFLKMNCHVEDTRSRYNRSLSRARENKCLRWNAMQTSWYNDDNRERWTLTLLVSYPTSTEASLTFDFIDQTLTKRGLNHDYTSPIRFMFMLPWNWRLMMSCPKCLSCL